MPEIEEWTKRPVTVRMLRWDGINLAQLRGFTSGGFRLAAPDPLRPEVTAEVYDKLHDTWVGVKTGDLVVCGVLTEFYPLDPEARALSFDPGRM